jgi:hypothetical protein
MAMLFVIYEPADAQWKKIFDFGNPILSVFFKDFTPNPQDGVVSH